ncbi:cutinase transcription factor 1 alpha [Fusarium oxysporum f. sp. phaseoli]
MKPNRRSRARQACRACNARRVRCNVVEIQPCSNCLDHDVPCELRESMRGRHRKKAATETSHSPNDVSTINIPPTQQHHQPLEPEHSSRPSPRAAVPSPQSVGQSVGSTERVDEASSSEADERDTETDYAISWEIPGYRQQSPPQQQQGRHQQREQQQNNNSQGAQSHNRPDDDETIFLGESTSIAYLHVAKPSPATLSTPDQSFVYRVPQSSNPEENLTTEWESERKRARLGLLQLEGAFSFLVKPAMDKVLKAYFQWFHICFPIVDEPDIWDQYQNGVISPILLQAMLFIGVMHCSEQDLHQVGLGSRQRAKFILYNRAKDLYDAEAEPRSLIVTQSVFLMSFWRAGALLQKDTRHWLAVAVSQAQTKGLHRARASRDTSDKVYHLRKRLWWSIYIRERQCAAALGLPNRLRDEDCDVEPLSKDDFQHAFDPSLSSRVDECIAYMIGMTDLSRMLGRIIHCDFLPSKSMSSSERQELKASLTEWRASLPACMQLSADGTRTTGPGFLTSMLHLAYNNLLILLFRSSCGSLGDPNKGSESDGQIAIQAAACNAPIIENMITENQMCHGQIHVITNIFNTLCVHTLHFRILEGGRRFIAENRAKTCLLSLQELQKTWEFKNWILQLFFQYLDRSTALRLRIEDCNGDPTAPEPQPAASLPKEPRPGHHAPQSQCESQGDLLCLDTDRSHDVSWPIEVENVGEFLQTQIEDRFVNGDGGAMDWYMADLFNHALPP